MFWDSFKKGIYGHVNGYFNFRVSSFQNRIEDTKLLIILIFNK